MSKKTKNSLRAWFWLVRSAHRTEYIMADRFRSEHNSSLTRFDVLANLKDNCTSCISTTKLSRQLMASKGNITRLLDRMENESLIARKSNPNDRRISDIHLTETGAKLFKVLAKKHQLWADEVFSALTDNEKEQLASLSKKVFERACQLEKKL